MGYVCSRCGGNFYLDITSTRSIKSFERPYYVCLGCKWDDVLPMPKEEFVNIKRTELIDKMLL